jgi:hypothetical protein
MMPTATDSIRSMAQESVLEKKQKSNAATTTTTPR